MKILFATPEFAPLIKTGGLADVAGSLPGALAGLGVDVRVLLPAYPAVLRALGIDEEYPVSLGPAIPIAAAGAMPSARLLTAHTAQGVELLLVHCPALYERPGNPYLGPDGKDWPDNDLRYGLFSRIAALLGTDRSPLSWRPDVVHCHDWQAALAPVHLVYAAGRRAGSVLTIHNLAYQGIFPSSAVANIALPPESFAVDGAEYYNQLSFLKGGLACADAITTVSPTYAREICGPALGFGLQGLLSARANVLTGILNGVDTQYWDPRTDPLIIQHFDEHSLDGKRANKRALQESFGLTVSEEIPLLGVVSRLVEQKGIDLIAELAPKIAAMPAQLVIQGLGDKAIETRLQALAKQLPRSVGVRIAFDEALAHQIEAGADAFLMPSRFEPCGMNQMYSQRYGTLPIVCRTGGLADSVTDCTPETLAAGTASGFSFALPTVPALLDAIVRALLVYRDRATWTQLQKNAMARDVSWSASAAQYVQVYRRVIERVGAAL